MQKEFTPATGNEPTDRLYTMSIIIRSFKGRKNVEAHLFRSDIPEAELQDAKLLRCIDTDCEKYKLEQSLTGTLEDTKRMVLECFTKEERDAVIKYLEQRYHTRLRKITTGPLSFPVPQGTMPLSTIPEGKSMGFIKFDNVPDYPLDFKVRGFYDLELHEPNVIEPE
ncbi:hypothetical protein [Halodesulfovibrio marinisediminis]|uniref:Uncharacterized protein n=1 Tax=Halodesulfovibrio marinisediminis DSM 17456 TaxID=1121457 RepID=A0A1N6E464_9BACT|nr:hypothetical protein [Halodesulfovibrio marinisediminis]SIN77804.1 hypothetical protein SAMN02745161_0694 [Halodesulfovibrio marinisediminis DSM 17456]